MKHFKVGVLNPLNRKNAHFDYEVVEDKGEVEMVEYEDRGSLYTYPRKRILIQTLGGNSYSSETFIVSVSGNDAYKLLREGEIISINLSFHASKDDDGNYVQRVTGDDIYTLNDYYQIREGEAHYKGKLSKDIEESD